MKPDVSCACAVSGDSNHIRVTSKIGDIVLDPIQGCHLVKEPIIPRQTLLPRRIESYKAEY